MPPKTTRKKSKSATSQGLISSLQFLTIAQEKENNIPYKEHCILMNKMAMAYNGTLTVGCKIEEELNVCPHTYKMLAALERTTKEVSITELDGRLSVKSGSFSAFVPCWHEGMPSLAPDPVLCAIDDRLKIGFDTIAHFAVEAAQKVILSSILVRANTMISTDSAVMLEYWHGINLPTMILPKSFISAVMNCKKKITGFGYSGNSATFWFEDESWIKTQLYDEAWPDTDLIMNKPCKPEPLPKGFYEALNDIEPFSSGKETEKVVYFNNGALQSHRDKNEGAVAEVEGIIHGPAFNIKRLKRIEHCIETVDFYSHNAAFFFGAGVRGCIMGVRA